MEKDDAIDSQIKRLEDYLLGNKQIVNAHEITIEQALALGVHRQGTSWPEDLIVWGTSPVQAFVADIQTSPPG
jgi:hypothetical protein